MITAFRYSALPNIPYLIPNTCHHRSDRESGCVSAFYRMARTA
jgi:hypothetical protein